MGKTHGVKMASRPELNATSRNPPMPSCCGGCSGDELTGAPGLHSRRPGGIDTANGVAFESILSDAVAVRFAGGRQRVASHTLYRISAVMSAGPSGSPVFSADSSRKSALFSYVCVSILKLLSKARLGSS